MMKVHFITSRPTLEKDIHVLRKVIDIIHSHDYYLAHDWIEVGYRQLIQFRRPIKNWGDIYKENLEAIAKSDIVIAETSYENFAVGYQIAVAIQQKKPVLLLRKIDADKNAFVTGVEDGWVQHGEYSDEKSLTAIVEKFLADNEVKPKDMRFNFYMDRKIHNYLRWASFRTGKAKSEVVRELLKRDIERRNF